MTKLGSKFLVLIITAIALLAVPGISAAHEGCEIEADIGKPCLVVNDSMAALGNDSKKDCVLPNILAKVDSDAGYCRITDGDRDANYILFQSTKVSGGAPFSTTTEITSPVTISLNDGQRVVMSGLYVPQWVSGYYPFHTECSNCFGIDSVVNVPQPGSAAYQAGYKAKIVVKNIPRDRAAFDISGGTVVFRDMDIIVSCDGDNDGVFRNDADRNGVDEFHDATRCGSFMKISNGAKVVFENSNIVIGDRIRSFVEVIGGGNFADRIAFSEGDADAGSSTLDVDSDSVFSFDADTLIKDGDIPSNAIFRLGFLYWGWKSEFIKDSDHYYDAVSCSLISPTKCIIDESYPTKFLYHNPGELGSSQVFVIDRDSGTVSGRGRLERYDIGDPQKNLYLVSIPRQITRNENNLYNVFLMTNVGEKIRLFWPSCPNGVDARFEDDKVVCDDVAHGDAAYDGLDWEMTCDDPAARYDWQTNSCVCPENKEWDSDRCVPDNDHELSLDGTQVLPECKGDAVPVNDSEERDARCVCPDPEKPYLTWTTTGTSRCKATPPSEEGEEPTPSDTGDEPSGETEEAPATDIEADECREMGGTLTLMGCELPVKPDSSEGDVEKGAVSGCSMVPAAAGADAMALIFLFAGLPISILVRRRARYTR